MSSSTKSKSPIVNFWAKLYNAAPKIYFPGTKFDIGFTILSAIFMLCVRLSAQHFWTTILGYDIANPMIPEIIVFTSSAVHSCILVPSLWYVLLDQPYIPSAPIANAPQYYKDASIALLSLCSGYMFYDFMFILIDHDFNVPSSEYPFIGHHFATFFYMNGVRIMGSGHISAMTLMWSGEWTNPIHNLHSASKYLITMAPDDSLWHVVTPYIEFIFAFFYFIFRGFIGPAQIVHIAYDMWTKEGRKNVPLKVSVFLIPLCSGVIIGSIPWTIEAYEMMMDGLELKYHRNWDYGPKYAEYALRAEL